ncbi:alkaline phytoceramidase [Obba rivulosa]|uniref:Alkaline phytoceramidase n=1 Tax=Obba rivulosa TaxID=1052685 RepID=A0A8E2AQS6_9APHY|nr:alkaline phytoceramidase [Obba rivulosa]
MAFINETGARIAHQFWGPVTATLDWCEANYQFSQYVAEATNTFSNLYTIALALYGAAQARSEGLPKRYLTGYTGFALIGLGSFIFHATLLFEAQLADELPMVYVASYCSAMLFDTQPGFSWHNSNALPLSLGFLLFNALFTWSYYLYRNPVYHQVVFAAIMLTNVFRTAYLLRDRDIAKRLPDAEKEKIARVFTTGVLLFVLGFVIWNLDNIFCSGVTGWKHALGWPTAFLLEGHSWWHILTATGTYLMLIGNTCTTLCIKDDYRKYTLAYTLGIPRIERVTKAKTL